MKTALLLLRRPLVGALALLALEGCFAIPSPLAPSASGDSVGSSSYGVLEHGMEMPDKGKGFELYRPWTTHRYGSRALVETLQEVSSQVGDGPPLVVGDLAGPHGGSINGHATHRTGRDVDLLFFFTTPSGVPTKAPGFLKVGTDGLAFAGTNGTDSYLALDIPRCWALVRALLRSTRAPVQWLFVARQIKSLLIEYAEAHETDSSLVWKAEAVLHQPTRSLPHDDHFHLRLRCTEDERVHGCVDDGPRWPWLQAFTPPTDEEIISDIAALVP